MQTEVRPELRPSTATGEAQAPGYEQKHHLLCRRSWLLHQTFCQLRQIPTVGAMPDLISHDGHPNQRSYISNQAANPFTPSASTSENDQQGSLILRCNL
ncbi:hypothetical protein Bca4012_099187 [Brassica carinata]|uniref:Uncharacterized protein n=1 Tax=Brassica carinata TaxID=52824 RepID=A0A8X7PIU5_BRACI|nr:hypothetical protein Bca52824_081828 [Brassica carinata]